MKVRLPPSAARKLSDIEAIARDAEVLRRAARARVDELGAQLYIDGSLDDKQRAGIEHEISRLRAIQQQRGQRHAEAAQLVARCHDWLAHLGSHVVLEALPPAAIDLQNGEGVGEALNRIRSDLVKAQSERFAVSQAPPPKAALRRQAHEYVQALAKRGKPYVHVSLESLRLDVKWRMRPDVYSTQATPEDVAATLAWLDPEAVTNRLLEEVEKLPEPELCLTDNEKRHRLAALDADIDRLERQEEALVERCAAEGIDVVRRIDASPAVILGVKIGSAAASRAA